MSATAGPASEEDLLARHRPLLRFDPQYDYRLLAASSAVAPAGNILRRFDGEVIARSDDMTLSLETLNAYPGGLVPAPDDCLAMGPDHLGDSRRMEWDQRHEGRIYGRVVSDGGRTWLQYWFWLYYNPKNLFGFGKHEGDWEMIQVGLAADGEPRVATYAQHDSGEAREWREGEIELSSDPRRPVVYIAPLSHASYFEPYTHPYWIGIDHPYPGPAADLPVAPFGSWVEWQGRWGSSERKVLGRIGGGPPSPAHQNPKWSHPEVWHRQMRRRRLRASLGRAIHSAGGLTFPKVPEIGEASTDGDRVRVAWELRGNGIRRERHLYITLHERHHVLASRIVRDAEPSGETTLPVPPERNADKVMASAYNGLRQRSEITQRPLDSP